MAAALISMCRYGKRPLRCAAGVTCRLKRLYVCSRADALAKGAYFTGVRVVGPPAPMSSKLPSLSAQVTD